MLYVFLVDTGTMLKFDMKVALQSVSQLKQAISRACDIPEDKQVLLISGGESLDSMARVCSYSAGTDTNPIFLFSKSSLESSAPPIPSLNYELDDDLGDAVQGALSLAPTYTTVVTRTQLAQQFGELSQELVLACDRLVHDQHLQHQGWAAVVANLEDITRDFRDRTVMFQQTFESFLERWTNYVHLLQNFSEVVRLLGRVPLLPALVDGPLSSPDRGALSAPCSVVMRPPGEPTSSSAPAGLSDASQHISCVTLLEWVGAKDPHNSLEVVAEQCVRGLDQLNETVYGSLREEMATTLEGANNASMKEVKGLEDRLYGLEQLMSEARKLQQEQTDLAAAFLQNQTRAGSLRDPSVLPDLCSSHRNQLLVMHQNHQRLRDIRKRCLRAKQELSENLHARLRWIMYIERTIFDVDNKLVIYHESLKRLRRHLTIIEQLDAAPRLYTSAVVEVVRRRAYSQHFMRWANDLSERASALHGQEMQRRVTFQMQFSQHFLSSLFPGLDDAPPVFAVECPPPFDCHLPAIRAEDVALLRDKLPEMADILQMPNVVEFEVPSVRNEPTESKKEDESEPDTEEFEKVDSSLTENNPEPLTAVNKKLDVSTERSRRTVTNPGVEPCANTAASPDLVDFLSPDYYIDESMPSSYSESNGCYPSKYGSARLVKAAPTRPQADGPQLHIRSARDICLTSLSQLRADLSELSHRTEDGRSTMSALLDAALIKITEEVTRFQEKMRQEHEEKRASERMDAETRHQDALNTAQRTLNELTERMASERGALTLEHELELETLRTEHTLEIQRRDMEIEERNAQIDTLRRSVGGHCSCRAEVHGSAVHARHKRTAGSGVVRSTSDSNLDQSESGCLLEARHRQQLDELRQQLDKEKLDALRHQKASLTADKQVIFNEALSKVSLEKDRRIAELEAQLQTMQEESARLTETMRSKPEECGAPAPSSVAEGPEEVTSSVAPQDVAVLDLMMASLPVPSRVFHLESSIRTKEEEMQRLEKRLLELSVTSSTTALIQQDKISILSCNIGDVVLVCYDDRYSNYIVFLLGPVLHFLHADSLLVLGLNQESGEEHRRMWTLAEVTEKEYCQAKKLPNRYRVPAGTKFYRIRAKPWDRMCGSRWPGA